MKKLLALLAVVLCVVSCQTEPEGLDVNVGGEQEVAICVSLPEATRASDSAEGAIQNLVNSDEYTIRYIFQVFYKGDESKAARQVIYSDGNTVSFPVRLVPGRDYNFVAWADVVLQDDKTLDVLGEYDEASDYRYNTENLKAVTFKGGEWKAMDETFDAYTDAETITYYGTTSINLHLTRPFAKLRVMTTDMVELRNLQIVPEGVTVAYTVPVYKSFDVTAQAANTVGADVHTFTYNLSEVEKYTATETTSTLFTNYLFGAENDIVKFTMKVNDTTPELIKFNNFNTDIPVRRNYLTTIKGNILTDGNNVTVDIWEDGKFEGNENWPDTNAEQLAYAAMFGGVVELDGDIDLTNTASNIVFINDATIKLNGHTIKAGKMEGGAFDYSALVVNNGATLTIEGEGTIQGGQYGIYAYDGNLTIKGGNIKANTSAVQVREGNVNIEGGVFSVTNSDNDTRYVINCIDRFYQNGSANVNITGGVFNGFNPGNNAAEGANTNFVAAGYKVIEKDGKFVVVPEDVDNVVANKGELTTALNAAVGAGETNIVVDANGANIGDLNYGLKTALVPAGRTVTIRNAYVEGKSYGNGVDGTVIFEGCTFNNSGAYSIHFDNGAGDVIFKSCKLYGWNSFGSTLNSVSFENCTLDGNGAYALIRSYVALTLTNCVINTTNANHTDVYPEGIEVVNGATKTEINVTYVVGTPEELKAAIINGGNIEFANDITVDEWIMFSEDLNVATGDIITVKNINVSIDGKGHTLTVNDIESAGNNDQLFQGASVLNISNLTIKYADGLTTGGLGMDSGVIKNVHFIGGGSAASSAAIFPHNGEIKVEDCIFDTNGVAFYFDDECDNLTVTRCTFNQKDNKNVILLRGDVKFTNNIINSGRTVNVVSGSPVVTGNNFNNVRFKVYGAATATISNNTINNLEFDGTTYASTFTNNTLSAAAQAVLDAATKVN